MKKFRRFIIVCALSIIFFFSGFQYSIAYEKEQSPSEVVKAAYMVANEGKYSEAEKYLSSEALQAVKGGAMAGGMKGLWDEATRDGTIERIEILEEEIRGEGATVHIRLYFKDGSTKKSSEPLIKEKGVWKLIIRYVW